MIDLLFEIKERVDELPDSQLHIYGQKEFSVRLQCDQVCVPRKPFHAGGLV